MVLETLDCYAPGGPVGALTSCGRTFSTYRDWGRGELRSLLSGLLTNAGASLLLSPSSPEGKHARRKPLDCSDVEGLLPAGGELGTQGRGLTGPRSRLGSLGQIPSRANLSNPQGQLQSPCHSLPPPADVTHRCGAKGHVTTGTCTQLGTLSFHSCPTPISFLTWHSYCQFLHL